MSLVLVLGGTVFLSRAVAAEAVARGHEVTCACRGESGSVPEGARHVALDRAAPDATGRLAELAARSGPGGLDGGGFDAVVEVSRIPSWVRAAVAALPSPHWVLVSTISVYADHATAGGTPATLPLLDPVATDEGPMSSPETYGAMKVACEETVRAGTASATVIRPGLVVGPGDPSGRFAYWADRLADGDRPEVLAPGSPEDLVQLVDVRDLAAWVVDCAERRLEGTFDAVGAPLPRAELLAETAAGAAPDAAGRAEQTLTWVPQGFLLERGVEPWSGPRSLPLWLPLPEYAGLMSHDVAASYAAGLVTRPLAETARDTATWLRRTPDAASTGLSREEEAEVLAEWWSHGGGRTGNSADVLHTGVSTRTPPGPGPEVVDEDDEHRPSP